MRRKCLIILTSVFLFLLSFVQVINAKESIETRSVETLLATGQIQLDKGGSNRGYVDCFMKVDYNIQARTYKVVAVYIQPHVSMTSPALLVGGVTATPAVGEYFDRGAALFVNFNAGEGTSGTLWKYTCRVSF